MNLFRFMSGVGIALIRNRENKLKIDWVNVLFLLGTALIALTVQPLYLWRFGWSWGVGAVFLFFLLSTGLSITAGYHRYFSHRSYRASAVLKAFYLLFGAAACQNSALKWASDHRKHHAYTEQEMDPYNINKGFFYAHMGWIFYKDPDRLSLDKVGDLFKDPMVRWQDRHYTLIAILTGGGVPLLIGIFLGDPLGCFLLAGVTRTVIVHHCTFLINSACHLWGRRPYSLGETARDNFLVAVLTHGEGYHNFHHQFPYDYRNGLHWYHWDPTKWWIRVLERVGLVEQPRRARAEHIFRAKVRVQKERAQEVLMYHPTKVRNEMENRLHTAYEAVISLKEKWEGLKTEYHALMKSGDETRQAIALRLRDEIQNARDQFYAAQETWHLLVRGSLLYSI